MNTLNVVGNSIDQLAVACINLTMRTVDNEEALGDEIATLAARLSVATHLLLTRIRRFDESEAWFRQGAQSCAHWPRANRP